MTITRRGYHSRCSALPGEYDGRAFGTLASGIFFICLELYCMYKRKGRKGVHLLSEIDRESKTATCKNCGPVGLSFFTNRGAPAQRCGKAMQERQWKRTRPPRPYMNAKRKNHVYRLQVASLLTCEHCGFNARDSCQIDVDHIDGDHKNNQKANLQALCANCHRLKTKKERLIKHGKPVPEGLWSPS